MLLASGIQQSYSVIYIYIHSFSDFFSHIDYYRTLMEFPVLYSRSLLVIHFIYILVHRLGFPGGSVVKILPADAGDTRDVVSIPRLGEIPWKRKWQPPPVFLPGKSHGPRSLAG